MGGANVNDEKKCITDDKEYILASIFCCATYLFRMSKNLSAIGCIYPIWVV